MVFTKQDDGNKASGAHSPLKYSLEGGLISLSLPIPVYENNNLCVLLAEHPVFHQHTKHIDIHFHFISEHIIKNQIILCQIDTNNQVADMLTNELNMNLTKLSSLAGMNNIRIKRRY